jgi:uncharacterized repeat protein (TIGR01451 family)
MSRSKNMSPKYLVAAALAAALAGRAMAGGIVLDATVMKAEPVTQKLVPASRAVPGDALVYALAYRNSGSQAAADVVLDNPVPANVVYRGGGAGGEPEVSVDGRSFASIAQLTVTDADGRRRPARLADVKFVRWHLATPIPAGAAGEVSFHAVLR